MVHRRISPAAGRLLDRLAAPLRFTLVTGAIACCVGAAANAGDAMDRQPDAPTDSLITGAPSTLDLPNMGEPADAAMSPQQEALLGARVVSELYQYEYILEDTELTDYLASVGWRLVAAAPQKPPRLDVFMVNDPRINAFALPGGHMGINAGLLIATDNESELAGVMGHELTHIIQRHIARSADDQGGPGSIATWAAVLAAIIAGSANPNVILAALAIGQSTMYQKMVNFTRANELEADRFGIQIMSDAGFDPRGMVSFFQRLEQSTRLYGSQVPEFLQTHPVNSTRIAEATARATAIEHGRPRAVADSADYALMKARTRVLVADRPAEAIDQFAAEIKSGRDTAANRYGLALAQGQQSDFKTAIATLRPVFDANAKQPYIPLLMADLMLGAGQRPEALALFKKIYDTYPSLTPVVLRYAAALITADKPDEARQLLLSASQTYGTRLETYRLLSQAARDAGNNGEASYEMANFLYYRGDYGGALAQLDAGLRIGSLSPGQRARMAARRADVREALPRNYNPYARRRPDDQ